MDYWKPHRTACSGHTRRIAERKADRSRGAHQGPSHWNTRLTARLVIRSSVWFGMAFMIPTLQPHRLRICPYFVGRLERKRRRPSLGYHLVGAYAPVQRNGECERRRAAVCKEYHHG